MKDESSRPKEQRPSTGDDARASKPLFQAVHAPRTTLAKGGGAIRSMGETFRANPSRGTLSFEVQLGLSESRQGSTPAVSLSYDSGAGQGIFGLGWGVGIGAITRRTDRGIPRYGEDDSDTFVLGGFEDLVPVLNAEGKPERVLMDGYFVTTYRPRTEGAFARIQRWLVPKTRNAHWRVTTRDNVLSIYGETAESRITDPSNEGHVFSWLLCRTVDNCGNVAFYDYKAEDLVNVPHSLFESKRRNGKQPFANRYIKRIVYGNTALLSADGDNLADVRASSRFEVVFDYGEHDASVPKPDEPAGQWSVRLDPFSTYRAGFEMRTYRLCRRVLMFHHFAELGAEPTLVRSVALAYNDDAVLTKLVSVTRKSHERTPGSVGPYSTKEFPPQSFGYTSAAFVGTTRELEPRETQLSGLNDQQWVDLEGDGLPGLIWRHRFTGTAMLYYMRNVGGGKLRLGRQLPTVPIPTVATGPLQIIDLGGDGTKQLVSYTGVYPSYSDRLSEKDTWEGPRMFDLLPNVNFNDPNLRFIDLNGDGMDDIVHIRGDRFCWNPAIKKGSYGAERSFERPRDDEKGPACVFAAHDHSIFLADMSGDGLTDIVRIQNGSVCYWPNMGHGKFGPKVSMSNAPRIDPWDFFDARRIRLADMDGSGSLDVLYVDGVDGVLLWRNQAGNSFAEKQKLNVYPSPDAQVNMVDLLGTGTTSVVWSGSQSARHTPVRYLDPFEGKKPHLLESVTNGFGLEQRFTFAPSTKFFLEDRKAGRPWVTRLPFPVQVLAKVESFDHVSRVRLVTEYRYRHGHYDKNEREFFGFSMVEQIDTTTINAAGLFDSVALNTEMPKPPALKKTFFHWGGWRRDVRDKLKTEWYSLDPTPPHLPDSEPKGIQGEDYYHANRALRGQVLREELYALDGSDVAKHPIMVTESSYSVRRLQARHVASSDWLSKTLEWPAVMLVVPTESITCHYERSLDAQGNPDPRVAHTMTLEVDDFGSERKAATIAYPRRSPAIDSDHAAQDELRVTLTETDVAHLPNVPSGHRLGVLTDTRTYEIHGLTKPNNGLFSLAAIKAIADGSPDAFPIVSYEETPPAGVSKRLVERARVRYVDSNNLPGPLPFDVIDVRALPYESYGFALTPGQIQKTFNHPVVHVTPPMLLIEGGYVELDGDAGYWRPSGRERFDAALFYQPTSIVDPFGKVTTIEYDAHALFVTTVTDPLGNFSTIENDYRVLSAWRVTESNGNRSAVHFDALGIVDRTAVMGKSNGPVEGDSLDDVSSATTTIDYSFFDEVTGKPNAVHVRARETHNDSTTRWQETFLYSDGAGREVMKKVRVEPGPAPELDANGNVVLGDDGKPVWSDANPRWVGTGRTEYDNKGNPIKKYEPYFSRTHEYETDDTLVHWGVTPILDYDPLGRLIRTDFPDGTFSKVTFTPWVLASFDQNDTVLEPGNAWFAERQPGAVPPMSAAEQRAATLAAAHANTTTVTELDTMGRPFLVIADAGGGKKLRTRTTLDIEGNPLVVTDARGNAAAVSVFDVAGRKMHQKSIDAGARWFLLDVLGKPIRTWGSAVVRTVYDALRRPVELWVQTDGGTEVLAERTVYGESHPNASALNLRGKVYQRYDGAGFVENEAFDFKGNLRSRTQRLAENYKTQLDWSAAPALIDEPFTTSMTYDALNRPTSITKPDQTEIKPTYNIAGLLKTVSARIRGVASWTPFVVNIAYSAKGQRESIEYGAGVLTKYTYDKWTSRLVQLTTTRASGSKLLQDLRYTFDPVGNIVEIEDKAQSTIFHGGEEVKPILRFEYDATYRLTKATGREHAGQNPNYQQDENGFPLLSMPDPNDPQALRNYLESYVYDDGGNIERMQHVASDGGWTRRYEIGATSNRLVSTSMPGDIEGQPNSGHYTHDAHGNMTKTPHLDGITWDFKDQMRQVDKGGGGIVYFVYDAAGERVRKVWEHSGIIEERIYLGGHELYRRRELGAIVREEETLHVMDGERRIAIVETKTIDTTVPPFTPESKTRYQLGNHLDSAVLELSDEGFVLSYEEYHPYGTPAYRATRMGIELNPKRYGFNGKERDDETGLHYYGARYYVCWLGRWTATDPAGMVDGPNLYAYVRGNPVLLRDANGMIGGSDYADDRVLQGLADIGRSLARSFFGPREPTARSTPTSQPSEEPNPTTPSEPASSSPKLVPKEPEKKPVGDLKVSDKAIAWVKSQETWHDNAIALGATVAWGHKITTQKDLEALEKVYGKGGRIQKSDPRGESMLRGDLNAQLKALAGMLKAPISQQQADALASHAFNAALFQNKVIIEKLNAGASPEEVAEHFFDIVKTSEGQGGVETGRKATASLGLFERRIGEARMFLLGRYEHESDELRTLGKELLKERQDKGRAPAVARALALPSYREVR